MYAWTRSRLAEETPRTPVLVTDEEGEVVGVFAPAALFDPPTLLEDLTKLAAEASPE